MTMWRSIWFCLFLACFASAQEPSTAVLLAKYDLESLDFEVRRAAAERLGRMYEPEVLVLLSKATQDPHPGVAATAYHSLSTRAQRLAEPEYTKAIEALVGGLSSGNEEVRAAALISLGDVVRWRKTASSTVWKAVARAVEDPSVRIKKDALKVISWLGGEEAFFLISGRLQDIAPEVREEAALRLGELKDLRGVVVLEGVLFDPTPRVRAEAAKALGVLGDVKAVESLIALLRDGDAAVRTEAARALGELKDRSGTAPLAEHLFDLSPRVKSAAALALGQIADPSAVNPLIAALSFPDQDDINGKISDSLAQIGEPAVEPLVVFWKKSKPNGEIKECDIVDTRKPPEVVAILTLKKIKTDRSTEALLTQLPAAGNLRLCIIEALLERDDERVSVSLMNALQEMEESNRQRLLGILSNSDGNNIPTSIAAPLAVLLKDAKPNTQTLILSILRKAPSEVALPSLDLLLGIVKKNTYPEDVEVALAILGRLGEPKAEDLMIEALRSTNKNISYRAGSSIAKLKSPGMAKKLLDIAKNPKDAGRVQALRALSFILLQSPDAEITEAVAPMIDDSNILISGLAARILSFSPGQKYSQSLLKYFAAADKNKTYMTAGFLVAVSSKDSVLPLLQALRSSDRLVQISAAWALGYTKDERVVLPLIEALKEGIRSDEDSQRAPGLIALNAAASLGLLRDTRALPALVACFGVASSELRANCVLSYVRVGGDLAPVVQLAQHDSSPHVRRVSILALGEKLDSSAVAKATLEQIAQGTTDNKLAQSVLSRTKLPSGKGGFIHAPSQPPRTLYYLTFADGMTKAIACDALGDLVEPFGLQEDVRRQRLNRYENEL